jgi:hypothetical protein
MGGTMVQHDKSDPSMVGIPTVFQQFVFALRFACQNQSWFYRIDANRTPTALQHYSYTPTIVPLICTASNKKGINHKQNSSSFSAANEIRKKIRLWLSALSRVRICKMDASRRQHQKLDHRRWSSMDAVIQEIGTMA